MKKKKLKLKKKNLLLIVFVLVFLYSSSKLLFFYWDLGKSKSFNENLVKDVVQTEEEIQENGDIKMVTRIDFEELNHRNPDTRGWIMYHGDIHYPVVQGSDNSYYLNHTFEQKKNSSGTIFMDYRNRGWNDQNVILYGHNSVDGTMFGSLAELFQEGYFDVGENHLIEILTPEESYTYQIFSYYVIEQEEYYITPNFSDSREFLKFLKDLEKRSYLTFDVELSESDSILTLSTCEGNGGTTKRKVVHAKRVVL